MAKAMIQGKLVTFEDGRVRCDDVKIQRLSHLLTLSVPEYEPEPNNQRARLAVEEIGGEILELDPPEPERSEIN